MSHLCYLIYNTIDVSLVFVCLGVRGCGLWFHLTHTRTHTWSWSAIYLSVPAHLPSIQLINSQYKVPNSSQYWLVSKAGHFISLYATVPLFIFHYIQGNFNLQFL